jgi:acetoin utilization protein AcuB
MLVRDRMSHPAITVRPDTPFQDALTLMRERHFRRMPVVDERGTLVGIVSERDLLHAAPSPATSLSVWEVNYLLWKLKIADVMTEDVLTVSPDTPIEDAAQLMISRKIGGLPVVDEGSGAVVGVITETDIFKAFTELLGGGEHGLRVEVRVPDREGVLARLTQAIYEMGGNIISLGTFEAQRDGQSDDRVLLVKVSGVDKEALAAGLVAIGDQVLDARVV